MQHLSPPCSSLSCPLLFHLLIYSAYSSSLSPLHKPTSTMPPPTAFATSIPLPPSHPLSPPSTSPRRVPRAVITETKSSPSKIPVVDVFTHYPPRSTCRPDPVAPVLIVPGFGADASEYYPMAQYLRSHLPEDAFVHVVPLTKATWLSTLGGRPVTNVLELIDDAVHHALGRTTSSHVSIVAHSAGGWISRIYLGDRPYPDGGRVWQGNRFVNTLVCLGTPHKSDEKVTLKNMSFVNESYPGAFHDHVKYVNFAGDGGSVEDVNGAWWRFWDKDWFQRISYRLTDSDIKHGPVTGDGIVPMSVAFLEDAHHNVCLKGVWHSPAAGRPWYGHPRVVEYWSTFLR